MSDILSKAREIPRGIGGYHHDIVQEMIAEIERLRADLQLMTEEHRAACEDRDLMMRERDEARRMVCGLDADIMEDQIEYAKHRGWDCFKEPAHAS